MFAGYQAAAARSGQGFRPRRYVKRSVPGYFRNRLRPATFIRTNRAGYGSVARTRGAAVTGEMKYFDTELQATNVGVVTTTWVAGTLVDPGTTINLGDPAVATPGCLFAPKVSASLNGRVGRKVKMLKCKLNGMLSVMPQAAQGSTDASVKVRLILVMDMQTNAAPMTSAQLLRDGGGPSTVIGSFQNPDQFGRFRVLKDKTFIIENPNMQTLSATNATFSQNGIKKTWKMGYRFRNPVDVHFNATNGGTVADIVDHSIHVIAGCDDAGLGVQISYYSRVSFKDPS